ERLAAMLLLAFRRLLDPPLSAQRQHAVLDANVDVVLLDLRQIGLDHVLVVGLDDIRARTPLHAFVGYAGTPPGHLTGIAIEEVVQLSEWAPRNKIHMHSSWKKPTWLPTLLPRCVGADRGFKQGGVPQCSRLSLGLDSP